MNAFVSILAIAAAILMIAGWWKMRTDQKKGKKSKGSYLLIAPATVLMVLYIILAIAHRNQPIVQETPDRRPHRNRFPESGDRGIRLLAS